MNPAAIMSLGFFLASGFNMHCGTSMHATDFFGGAKLGDMEKIIAKQLGF